MREKPDTKTNLLENGLIVCDGCKCEDDSVRKRLRVDDTYAGDLCDRCGYNAWAKAFREWMKTRD
jgi:hypothetical protein